MAGFKTHISTSTMVGVAYGYWGATDQGMSLESALLAGGLCSVSGMLPDLDSDSGVPLRETSMFLAAIAPMLMIDRWRDMGLSHESMALAAMLIYIAIRFVAVEFFRRYTVHRGMWHSIPAALIAGLIAYLLMPSPSEGIRVYKSLAVFVGFMTHLILDEIWSIDFSRGRLRTKKSFGTALKFFGSGWWVNFMVYAKLGVLIYFAHNDHAILDRMRQRIRLDREQYTIPNPENPNFMYPNPGYPNPVYPASEFQPPSPASTAPGPWQSVPWQAPPPVPNQVAQPDGSFSRY
ncbi:metal-dependent hydrolase [Neorhodopirellula pilleata]|uniref:metal-dependent hydrolase n=1 Tax=Neorhodopirellula pilleata TaxID=2714738 RepID=UPI001E6471BE|nr:metal-dependent hydrolase [Neorhodopirellula pilleata]